MESQVKERLKEFINSQNISIYKFERLCGLSVGYVANMRSSISPNKTSRIAEQFPLLNIEWLLTGRGEMLKHEISSTQPNEAFKASQVRFTKMFAFWDFATTVADICNLLKQYEGKLTTLQDEARAETIRKKLDLISRKYSGYLDRIAQELVMVDSDLLDMPEMLRYIEKEPAFIRQNNASKQPNSPESKLPTSSPAEDL